MIRSYKDLTVWKKAMRLTDDIYIHTEAFPKREWFGLADQMRRAAVSIPSNIAEGSVRGTKEFRHFITIARGSLAELETQIMIANSRKFITKPVTDSMLNIAEEISKMLMALSRSLKN